jgi:flagellar biosynthesis/type III secretory pathway protein FliH
MKDLENKNKKDIERLAKEFANNSACCDYEEGINVGKYQGFIAGYDYAKEDIRNKLSPIKNLIAMFENGLVEGNVDVRELVLREIENCKISVEYLSNI